MKIKIDVTKENIDKGKPEDAKFCPIALAFKDFWRYENIEVNNKTIDIGIHKDIDLPDNAIKFIDRFDKGKKVGPFQLTIEIKK